jgi:hypothetical protein
MTRLLSFRYVSILTQSAHRKQNTFKDSRQIESDGSKALPSYSNQHSPWRKNVNFHYLSLQACPILKRHTCRFSQFLNIGRLVERGDGFLRHRCDEIEKISVHQ